MTRRLFARQASWRAPPRPDTRRRTHHNKDPRRVPFAEVTIRPPAAVRAKPAAALDLFGVTRE
jgi:hypothetical protein